MGKREKKSKKAKVEVSSSEEENKPVKIPIEPIGSDDEEANEDLSLRIVKKAMLRACNNENDGVSGVVTDLKKDAKKKKEKKRKKKSVEVSEVPEVAVAGEIDEGFRDFCGELLMVE